MYDVIIIGGGPAGAAAAVYSARKKLKTLLITESFGGQSIVSNNIENWVGAVKISGLELAKSLENHVRAQEDIEIKNEKVTAIKVIDGGYKVSSEEGAYQGKTLIVATGGRRRHLNILGEQQFDGKGVAYCSTCDAPIFKNKTVAVIGGGNAGGEAIIDLLPYASEIYWVNRSEPTCDPLTIEMIKKSSKVKIINNAEMKEIIGDNFVTGLKYLDKQSGEEKELEAQGIFVEIGSMPNSEIVKDLVKTNESGEIIIDHKTAATSQAGIFAAGDVTDEIYKQNNISAGDAVRAALSAYNYLLNIKKQSPAHEPSD